jgi:uncharacterized protein YjbI with pentapeptide repeats
MLTVQNMKEAPDLKKQVQTELRRLLLNYEYEDFSKIAAAFREAFPEEKIDLRQLDLSKRLIKNLNLSNADFSESTLKESVFKSCNFSNSVFHKTNFQQCFFQECSLQSTSISDIENSYKLVLADTDLSDATLTSFNLSLSNGVGLKNALFNRTTFLNVNLSMNNYDGFEEYFVDEDFSDEDFDDAKKSAQVEKAEILKADTEAIDSYAAEYEEDRNIRKSLEGAFEIHECQDVVFSQCKVARDRFAKFVNVGATEFPGCSFHNDDEYDSTPHEHTGQVWQDLNLCGATISMSVQGDTFENCDLRGATFEIGSLKGRNRRGHDRDVPVESELYLKRIDLDGIDFSDIYKKIAGITFENTFNFNKCKIRTKQVDLLIDAQNSVLGDLNFDDLLDLKECGAAKTLLAIDGNQKCRDIPEAMTIVSAVVRTKRLSDIVYKSIEEATFKKLISTFPQKHQNLVDFCKKINRFSSHDINRFSSHDVVDIMDMVKFSVSSLVLPKMIEVLNEEEIKSLECYAIDQVVSEAEAHFIDKTLGDKTPLHLLDLSKEWHQQDYSIHIREFGSGESWHPILKTEEGNRLTLDDALITKINTQRWRLEDGTEIPILGEEYLEEVRSLNSDGSSRIEIVNLACSEDLKRESDYMDHCIGRGAGYDEACRFWSPRGENDEEDAQQYGYEDEQVLMHAFSIRTGDTWSTLAVDMIQNGENGEYKFVIQQHRGFGNSEPPKSHQEVADWLIASLQQKANLMNGRIDPNEAPFSPVEDFLDLTSLGSRSNNGKVLSELERRAGIAKNNYKKMPDPDNPNTETQVSQARERAWTILAKPSMTFLARGAAQQIYSREAAGLPTADDHVAGRNPPGGGTWWETGHQQPEKLTTAKVMEAFAHIAKGAGSLEVGPGYFSRAIIPEEYREMPCEDFMRESGLNQVIRDTLLKEANIDIGNRIETYNSNAIAAKHLLGSRCQD